MQLLFEAWVFLLTFFLFSQVGVGLSLFGGTENLLFLGAMFAVVGLATPKVIEFLKININAVTYFLFSGFLFVGMFYLLDTLFVGFISFDDVGRSEDLFGLSFLGGFVLNKTQVILVNSVFSAIIATTNRWLLDKY